MSPHQFYNLCSWARISLVPNTNMLLVVMRTLGLECARDDPQNALCQAWSRKSGIVLDYIPQIVRNASDKSYSPASRSFGDPSAAEDAATTRATSTTTMATTSLGTTTAKTAGISLTKKKKFTIECKT